MRPTVATPAAALLLLAAAPLGAQTPAAPATQPGVFVLSSNKCPGANLRELRAITDSTFAIVLNELVQENKLMGWGMLGHAWGDEWNWMIYYTAASHRAFVDAWTEVLARTNQRWPGTIARITPLCTEHKDNIYSVTVMRGRP